MTAALISTIGRAFELPETAVGALWLGERALFAAGDGSVQAHDATEQAWVREGVHDGALLSACAGFADGLLTGGDDGRVAAVGKDVVVFDAGGEKHRFAHDASVSGVAFEPNGRRIAAAHYNGATISWAASPESRRKTLAWKGAHLSAIWSPDAKFLVTTMQEQALHGWRLQDGQHFRMDGYPAKIRSVSFSGDKRWLATAGAPEVVLWPFQGPNGPIGTSAAVAGELGAPCTAVACHPTRAVLAAGGADGELAMMPLGGGQALLLDAPHGSRVTALAWSADGRLLAFGCESGRAGVLDFSDAL